MPLNAMMERDLKNPTPTLDIEPLKKGESLEILILQKLSPFYSLVKLYLA